MRNHLPGLVVTGASGFVGRNFVLASCNHFEIYCIARRSQGEVGIPQHRNINWLQTDISDWEQVKQLIAHLRGKRSIDYVLHLAGYYDFTLKDNTAYRETNINGTLNILWMAEELGAKRFFFSSSLAGCEFTGKTGVATEETPLSANFPYARSKREAESIIQQHSRNIPCTVFRLGAVFSDWCEYSPLYIFLETWLSTSPISYFIGGKGEFAIPYIHIRNVIDFINHIIGSSHTLPRFGIYLASEPEAVTLNQIYASATKCYYNKELTPIYLPRLLSILGLYAYVSLFRLLRVETFLRPWMAKYIDKQLNVDPTRTFEDLGWYPKPRFYLTRRILFLLENKSMYVTNWHFRNQILFEQRVAYRRNIEIYQILYSIRNKVVRNFLNEITAPINQDKFSYHNKMERQILTQHVYLIFHLYALCLRNRERSFLTTYNQLICTYRFHENVPLQELKDFIHLFDSHLKLALQDKVEKRIQPRINTFISLTTQYMIDEREDIYETLEKNPPTALPRVQGMYTLSNSEHLKWLVRRLENVYGDPIYLDTEAPNLQTF